ncbi:hypothetical protein OG705_16450 [Streptomyces sp. NBC_00838]|uniref:hypothetical protein n=1 Tax=Streptomyces sp. NBC_00838 TaxID=2903680 RepID=UPI0038686071|nr:hypothetical protein OG705_16450 [Streptomyces sp. NBC_00838]
MSGSGVGEEIGVQGARSRAAAVLRVRGRAMAVALLPAAAAVVLLAGGATGRLTGGSWDAARWVVTGVAVAALLCAAAVAFVITRARPALSPTVEIAERSAPDLYRLVRDLAERLDVPAPSAIALTPDCDSWLEDRTHPAHAPVDTPTDLSGTGTGTRHARGSANGVAVRGGRHHAPAAPVLVIGSPFLWWMRVAELRAVLAPVVAGTGPASHPDIAAARRFVRGLDAAVALSGRPDLGLIRRAALVVVGRIARLMLRACGEHAALMERGVASAASERAQGVDYGLRIVAQEQVGLAYAGWDRLLTRVALPAWRMGRWPSRLDVGVVSALTELSRRDRLADGFTSRLGERPACDLLEEPGAVDEAASLLAARLFHGGPAASGPDWSPVDWQQYPEEVVDRKWRTEAARLHRVLDDMGVRPSARPGGSAADPSAARVLGPTLARVMDHLAGRGEEAGDALAAGISAEVAREEAAAVPAVHAPAPAADTAGDALALRGTDPLPLLPLMPPRTGRELLADHVTAMVCCAAVDTAGAAPGLDWLDGPALLMGGVRRTDLAGGVLSLVEDGDVEPLRTWLASTGVRPEKPVRLV